MTKDIKKTIEGLELKLSEANIEEAKEEAKYFTHAIEICQDYEKAKLRIEELEKEIKKVNRFFFESTNTGIKYMRELQFLKDKLTVVKIVKFLRSEDKGYGFISHSGDCTNEAHTCLCCLSLDVAQALIKDLTGDKYNEKRL